MANPNLGYGHQSEASIDAVNQWMRSQPWWAQIRGGGGGDLSQGQRDQIMRAAQQAGVVIDQGDMEIDRGGNINPKGHKLRNTLLVAGGAAATIAGGYGLAALAHGVAGAGAAAGATGASGVSAVGAAGAGAAGAGAAAAHGGIGGFLASSAGLSLGKTLADTFTNVYGMKQQLGANERAATLQADASRYSTDAQSKATAEALAYTKEQDLLAQQRAEVDRRANFDQYMTRARGAQNLGDSLGFHVDLPDYVPSSANGGQGWKAAPADEKAASFITEWQKSHAPSEGIEPLAAALKANGINAPRFMYGDKASNNELVVGGQKFKVISGELTPGAQWYTGGDDSAPGATSRRTIGSVLAPRTAASAFLDPSTVQLKPPPPGVFRPNTIAAYLRS